MAAGGRDGRIAAGAFLATPVLLIAGLASWYQPYGWFACGPRLLLPWVPTALLLVGAALFLARSRACRQLTVLWNRGLEEKFFGSMASCRQPVRGRRLFRLHRPPGLARQAVLLSALGGLRLDPTPALTFAGLFLAAVVAVLVRARAARSTPEADFE